MLKSLPTDEAFEFYRTLIEWRCMQQGGAATYVEIGCASGWFTARIAKCVRRAIGVDMVEHDDWDTLRSQFNNLDFLCMSSDHYFSYANNYADVIFIDGSHESHQVKRDISNSLEMLDKEGLIVVHDTLPPDAAHTSVGLCGDAYKAIAWARKWADIQVFTFPVRFGVTLISPKHVYNA